jgi:hypothetical protein
VEAGDGGESEGRKRKAEGGKQKADGFLQRPSEEAALTRPNHLGRRRGGMAFESAGRELERLFIAWPKLPEKSKAAILVLAGVRDVPGPGPRTTYRRVLKGETPDWLAVALNLLKDSKGYMSDREIARRVGVSHTLLCRHPDYQRAKRVFVQPVRKVVKSRQ